jgi:hypothetical protein
MKMKKVRGLSLQLIPHSEIEKMGSSERIKKILSLVVENKIVMIQGRLKSDEEARLIEDTMVMVDHVKNFKGIELAVIEPDNGERGLWQKLKAGLAKKLTGDSSSLTIVGPSSIVKEIKRDPKKIELLLS